MNDALQTNIDFSAELAKLIIFAGDVATAIRMYSAYSGGSPSNYLKRRADPELESVELMFLADALHHFSRIGEAIQSGSPGHIVAASDAVLRAFSHYDAELTDSGARHPKPTFDAWAHIVRLFEAREAIAGIRSKAAAMIDV
ncbi:hypothetical protein [Burkholderia cenocepacia]|uniref:hypothetical protein n=1 Tax=Burkholderia cenocepacia TaxID=95486 RepID=UPI0013E05AAC|nr:hypothetical protein [Burkholderia cenocepacia]MCW3589064.1 hypothetical protein [Burkholderia cenocepacia]MCW3632534.1 hypothetical protein [Burkholderia cenocepacia]MCW5181764.1 hypothetical protein [Burkholderia cenocepacia]